MSWWTLSILHVWFGSCDIIRPSLCVLSIAHLKMRSCVASIMDLDIDVDMLSLVLPVACDVSPPPLPPPADPPPIDKQQQGNGSNTAPLTPAMHPPPIEKQQQGNGSNTAFDLYWNDMCEQWKAAVPPLWYSTQTDEAIWIKGKFMSFKQYSDACLAQYAASEPLRMHWQDIARKHPKQTRKRKLADCLPVRQARSHSTPDPKLSSKVRCVEPSDLRIEMHAASDAIINVDDETPAAIQPAFGWKMPWKSVDVRYDFLPRTHPCRQGRRCNSKMQFECTPLP